MTKHDKTKRIFAWVASNGFLAGAIYAGWGLEIDGAKNVAVFLLWFFFATSFVVWAPTAKKQAVERGLSVPYWANASFDVACGGFLVWHGSWVLAVVVMFTMLNTLSLYEDQS